MVLSIDDAIRYLRSKPQHAGLVHNAYLGRDTSDSALRFAASGEFAAVQALLNGVAGKTVIDIGAGTGIASYAFRKAGAERVYALEPDPSDEVGRGAMSRLPSLDGIIIVDGQGEAVALPDESVDIAYCRQVLHHVSDLEAFFREVRRILRPGGLFIGCREHVVDNDTQLSQFLARHPVHRLAGGENAYPLSRYLCSISDNDFKVELVLGPWDSVINAFPIVKSNHEIREIPSLLLQQRFGKLGGLASKSTHTLHGVEAVEQT